MKRVAFFLALTVILDAAIGAAFDRIYPLSLTGERGGLTNYALTKDADILVLGSSRAQYHIMPSVLQRRLSLRAYNAGLRGHDFLYAIMLYDLWKRAHPVPRAVLLHIDIESMLERQNEIASAQIFAPFLDQSKLVREVLYSDGPYKRFEYLSRAYRYNGKALAIAKNLFARQDPNSDGYIEATGELDPAAEAKVFNALDQEAQPLDYARRPYSQVKLRYLRELAADCVQRGSRLFLVHTPRFRQDLAAHRIWMERMRKVVAGLPGVEIIDISEATRPEIFLGKRELYSDVNHLKGPGAELLSTLLADELTRRLFPTAKSH